MTPQQLISTTINANLPQGYIIRPLERSDYEKGFARLILGYLDVLKQLTDVGQVSLEQFQQRFDLLAGQPNTFFCIVVEEQATGRVVG